MKLADPSIHVTCSGPHGPNAAMDPYLFQAAGKQFDLISVHQYWIPNYGKHQTLDYLACMTDCSVAAAGITADRLTHGRNSVAVVDPVATVSETGGAWAIALVNRHPADAVDCRVLVNRTPLEGAFTATVLAGDSARRPVVAVRGRATGRRGPVAPAGP